MDDLITQESTSDGLFIFRNLQNVESDGIELELKGRLAHGLEGDASYSFQQATDRDTHQFLDNSPRDLGKVDLNSSRCCDELSSPASMHSIEAE